MQTKSETVGRLMPAVSLMTFLSFSLNSSSKAIPVDEKEETFPRGGQELLTPLERNVIKSKAKQDLLFAEVSVRLGTDK